jgi:hypothetical protein
MDTIYHGYTPTIDRDTQLTNKIAACKEFIAADPNNTYWRDVLLQAEIEQEARRAINWLADVELHETPSVEWLEEAYLLGLESDDHTRTMEDARL